MLDNFSMMVLYLVLAFGGLEETRGHVSPQATETLVVDDGVPTGIAALPIPGGIELVRLPLPQWGRLTTLLYYPGRLLGFETPILHWIVFNDDGPGGLPGTPLGFGTVTNLSYDSWYPVNVSSQYIVVNPGYVYVGWICDTSWNPLMWYQNWYDSAPDGHNYTFSIIDTAWVKDTLTPGDYMVRAILETIDVEEDEGAASYLCAFPNPSMGRVEFLVGQGCSGSLWIYDPGGRLVLRKDFVGRLSVHLDRGVYIYSLNGKTGVLTVR